MNEQTRHFAHMTAGAIVSLGRAYASHFDNSLTRMQFDCLAQNVLDMHKDGTIDFEGIIPVFPDLRDMRPLQKLAAMELYVIAFFDHIVCYHGLAGHDLKQNILRHMYKASRGYA